MHPASIHGCARILGASMSALALSLFLFMFSWLNIVGLDGVRAASAANAASLHSGIVVAESATSGSPATAIRDTHMANSSGVADGQQMPIPGPQARSRRSGSAVVTPMPDMPGMTMDGTPMPDMSDMPGMTMDGTPMPGMSASQPAIATATGTAKDSGMGDMPMPEAQAATGHQHGHTMAGMPDAAPSTAPQPTVKATILGGFAAVNLTVLVSAGILKRMNARVAAAERAEREAVRRD